MKKLLACAVLSAVVAAASVPAAAATVGPANFNVAVTLTSACQLTTSPSAINLAYTSFGTAQAATTSFAVQCTNTLPYTMALDSNNANTLGLLIPVAIMDSTNTNPISGAQTAGAAATTYVINASITAGQQGTCATATCTSTVAKTLTITY